MFCFRMDGQRLVSKNETRNNRNRHVFRQVARDSSGEIFDVPEGNRLVFCYLDKPDVNNVVAVASWAPAREGGKNVEDNFENNYNHVVTYLFVKAHFKGMGIGSRTIQHVLREMKALRKRPVRVLSAAKAVSFFEKHGFVKQSEPEEMVCGGSPLFRFLAKMEKDV